jgi:homoserine kinase
MPTLGATLSGAGPTVLVWCEPGAQAAVAAGLADLDGCRAAPLAVSTDGARID